MYFTLVMQRVARIYCPSVKVLSQLYKGLLAKQLQESEWDPVLPECPPAHPPFALTLGEDGLVG